MKRIFLCMVSITALFIANAQLSIVPGQQKAMSAGVSAYQAPAQHYNNDSNLYAALSFYRSAENNEPNCHPDIFINRNNCEECDFGPLQDLSPEAVPGVNYSYMVFNSGCDNGADVNENGVFSEIPGISECVAFVNVIRKVGTVIRNKKKTAFIYQKPAVRRSKSICPYNMQWTCPGKDKFLRDGSQLYIRLR